jgi:hypothetical protein
MLRINKTEIVFIFDRQFIFNYKNKKIENENKFLLISGILFDGE